MTPYIRYGDYPISYNTGMANMSVPLYTIKVKDFSFPVDISFHASGRRTDLDLSTMGVGWVLNATGFISREIRGRPDELAHHPGMEVSVNDISFTNGVYDMKKQYHTLIRSDVTLQRSAEPESGYYLDSEHDLYNYSVNGMSGKFVLNDFGNAVPLTAVPYHFITDRIIIDEKGVRYEFGDTGNEMESTTITHQGQPYTAITGYYLSKIILPSGEVITFTYGSRYTGITTDNVQARYTENYELDYSQAFFDSNYAIGGAAQYTGYAGNYLSTSFPVETNIGNSGRDYTIKYLTSINFGNGQVVFNYNNNNLQLTDMEVIDAVGNQIKRADFTYTKTPGTVPDLPNNNSISLSTLIINGQKYTFGYDNSTLSSNSNTIAGFCDNKDWWGYCNAAGNNVPMNANPTAREDIAVQGHGCTDCKTPDTYKFSGMLKTINYPTGGSTNFYYEANKYQVSPDAAIQEGPGLRIAQIVNDDGTGNKVTRQFKYGQIINGAESGAGTLLYIPKATDFKSTLKHATVDGSGATEGYDGWYNIYSWYKSPMDYISEAYQLPVYYSTVTEYTMSSDGTPNGKTIYDYQNPEYVFSSSYPAISNSFTLHDWTVGQLSDKQVYKYRPAQQDYQILRSEHTNYTDPINYVKIPQVRYRRTWKTEVGMSEYDYWEQMIGRLFTGSTQGVGDLGTPYAAIDWPIESAVKLPAQQLNTDYVDGVAALTTETDLFYDNPAHLQPTRAETFTSKADEKQITQTSYVQDFSSPGTATAIQQGITNFSNRFIIAPVEVSHFKSPLTGTPKRLVSSQRFTFNPAQAVVDSILSIDMVSPVTNFVPLSITTGSSGGVLTKDSRYSKKISFDKYDVQSNLLQQHLENGVPRSYVWGYNKQYPIAEIINAAVTDVWYEGFEEATGSTIQNTATAKTGTKTKSDGYTKSLTGLTSGKYTLTYWRLTSNVWSRVIVDNIDVSTGNYTISISSSEYVDEIRFYPKDARMTTYTYRPLVGITSVMDAKGLVTYYSYDYNNRLKSIKDQDGNIIKSYEYHYKP